MQVGSGPQRAGRGKAPTVGIRRAAASRDEARGRIDGCASRRDWPKTWIWKQPAPARPPPAPARPPRATGRGKGAIPNAAAAGNGPSRRVMFPGVQADNAKINVGYQTGGRLTRLPPLL